MKNQDTSQLKPTEVIASVPFFGGYAATEAALE